jgi:MFS family permease
VLHASLVFLLPGAIAGFVTATLSGRFIDRYGARPVLMSGAVTGMVGFLWLALVHSLPWQVITAGILVNAYISLGYGALPALVVSEVKAGETGVATGVNAISRTVGSSIAAAAVAVLLEQSVGATGMPSEHAFVVIFLAGAVTAGLAMVLIALSRSRSADTRTAEALIETRAMNHEWG